MKKITIGLIIVIFLAIVGITIILILPKLNESNIKDEIEKANYCNIDSDCIDIGGKCPFGCNIYINKNEAIKISRLVESFDSKCVYGCVLCPTAICENNKCKAVCE